MESKVTSRAGVGIRHPYPCEVCGCPSYHDVVDDDGVVGSWCCECGLREGGEPDFSHRRCVRVWRKRRAEVSRDEGNEENEGTERAV